MRCLEGGHLLPQPCAPVGFWTIRLTCACWLSSCVAAAQPTSSWRVSAPKFKPCSIYQQISYQLGSESRAVQYKYYLPDYCLVKYDEMPERVYLVSKDMLCIRKKMNWELVPYHKLTSEIQSDTITEVEDDP